TVKRQVCECRNLILEVLRWKMAAAFPLFCELSGRLGKQAPSSAFKSLCGRAPTYPKDVETLADYGCGRLEDYRPIFVVGRERVEDVGASKEFNDAIIDGVLVRMDLSSSYLQCRVRAHWSPRTTKGTGPAACICRSRSSCESCSCHPQLGSRPDTRW